jgi:hypothetical protein
MTCALIPRTLAAAWIATSTAAIALPMGSVDTWMVMGDFASDSSELAVNYALTPRDAIGVAAGRWRSEPQAGESLREFGGLTYTRLLHRWNLPHAQANLWFVFTSGALRDGSTGRREGLFAPSVMADYETTRVYLSAGYETMRAKPVRHDSAYLRAGFSFYEVDYEDVQPWLIAEVKRERDGVAKTESIAWLRFIHKRYFVELGADDNGRARFNLMLNYW